MASEGGKIKSKRRQAANKPYDRNLTLFGKLRKSMKDLLIPSWLSGSYQQSERQATGDACQITQASTLSAVENNNFRSGIQLHNRPGDGLAAMDQTASYVDLTKDHGEPNVLGLSGHNEGTSINIGEPYMDIHHAGKVSGISSGTFDRQDGQVVSKKSDILSVSKLPEFYLREPQRETVDPVRLRMSDSYLSEADDHNTETTGVHTIMTSTRLQNQSLDVSHSVTKRQRLWSPESDLKGKYLMSPVKDKPAFNSFLLGSQSDSAMLDDSFNKSLFYPGKTRFGGASAERRTSLNSSLPYQSSLPLRKQVRAHNVSNNIQATTSATAQRILETLDRMSTPLGDAKKIPVNADSPNDSVLTFTPSSYRRISYTSRPMTRPLQLPSRGPPTSQHKALAQAVIARNRHRSGVVDKRQIADEEEGDDSMTAPQKCGHADMVTPVSSENRISAGQHSGVAGKMKVKRFSQHISSIGTDDGMVVEAPNLRTDFTLPVSNMVPISLQPEKFNTVAQANIPSNGQSVPLKFTFSAPIDEKRQVHSQISAPADKSFKFTSPIQTSRTKTSAAGAEGESKTCQEPAVGASSGTPLWASSAAFTASVPAWGSTAAKPKISSPDIGGTSSSFKSYSKWGSFDKQSDSSAASDTSVGFSLAPAASLMKGSVMDVLGGGKSSAPGTDDLMAKFKKPAGSWECDACMLVNKPETNKCICCETARPGTKPTQSPGSTTTAASISGLGASSPSNADSFMTGVKTLVRTSECDTSALSNKAGTFKASDTTRTGAKQPQNGTENSLSSMFKKPAGAWECDTCMVQNTAGALRCIACDSSKPGLQAAGIVPKPSVASSGSPAVTISPAGGFTFNTAAISTTTSGSGGFKFGNAKSSSTPSTSLPAATGFIFGQTSANTESSSKSLTGSAASTPLTGGFKFGATSPEGDSGGTSSGTSSFGVPNSGLGFVFGNSTSSILPAKAGDSVFGVQSGEAPKISTSNVPDSKSGSFVATTAANSQSELRNNGIPSTTDLSKSNSAVSSQFGSVLGSSISNIPASGGILQSGTQLDSTDNNTKLAQQQVNFKLGPSSAATPTFMTIPSQAPDSSATKPAGTLFQFGATSVAPESSIGLGMGNSLSSSKPIVNGGFGSTFEVQAMKDDSKSASLDTNKSFGGFTFGTTAPAFGGFGQGPAAASRTVISQVSQSSKRQVDFGESDHSSAKKPFNFGTGVSEPASNGLFAFGGSAAGSSTGGFMFNSTANPPAAQTGGPTSGSGFQFSVGSSAVSSQQGFNFSFKAQNENSKPFEAPTNKGSISFNPTPNFNFAAVPQQTSVFQFGAKPAENITPAAGVFGFGSTQAPSGNSGGPGFGSSAGMGAVGGFSIGAGDSGRKIKKAVRRSKK